jgi:hypothetical protein
MIHGKKVSLKGFFYLKKKHFCPKCKKQLEPITISKVNNSKSTQISHGIYAVGNIKFSWKELRCSSCDCQITIEEMQRIELENEEREHPRWSRCKQTCKMVLFKLFLAVCTVLFFYFCIFKKF